MPALATYDLTKEYAVGFWRKQPHRVPYGPHHFFDRGRSCKRGGVPAGKMRRILEIAREHVRIGVERNGPRGDGHRNCTVHGAIVPA